MCREGYKQTEVGWIPDDWEVVKFSTCFSVMSGKGFQKSEYSTSGLKLVRIDNVSWGKIAWDTIEYLPMNYSLAYPELILAAKDILLALNRPITQNKLKIAKIGKKDLPAILYQRVGKIIPLSEMNKNFAFHLLNGILIKFIKETSLGSDQPFISTNELKKLLIVKTPLPEQKKIAKILDTLDTTIRKTEDVIEKQKKIKQGLLHDLLTKGIDQNGNLRTNLKDFKPSELGMIPKEWEVKKLGEVCINRTERITENKVNDNPYVGLEHLKSNNPYIESCGLAVDSISTNSIFYEGDTLFGKLRPNLKKCVQVEFYGYCSTDILVISSVGNNNRYITRLFQSDKVMRFAVRTSIGTKMPRTSWSQLNKFKLPLPSLQEQKRIAQLLDKQDQQIQKEQSQLDKLKTLKKGLMNDLLTGKVRVKV
jgi:type I restriction enzyme, S subunit